MAQTSIITGQYVCLHQEAATVVQRFLAWLIDYVIITVGGTIFALATSGMVYLSEDIAIIWILLMTLIIMAYPLYMEIFNNGQTVGKSVMSIRVMCLDGSKPSKTASMLRWLLYLIDIFMGMGLFFVVFSKNCQRVGDLAAGTTVVKVKREKRPFVLSDYQFTKVGYLPSYPEVTKLNMRQVSVIENVLYTNNDQMREAYIDQLALKVEDALGVLRGANVTKEQFLRTVYNDFQYYALEAV